MDVRVIGSTTQGSTRVDDITIELDDARPPIKAYRVTPPLASAAVADGAVADPAGPRPGILWAHWFDPEAPDGNRTQYLDEAVELAGFGATSILPQGRFPWSAPPSGAVADVAAIEEEVRRTLAALDALRAAPGVDPARLAIVGHDFGGMTAIVAADDGPALRALVVVAATPRWGDWLLPFWPITDDRIEYLRALRPLDPIERIGTVRAACVLLQVARHDFFIAPMTGLELHRAAPGGSRLEAYDDDHAMRAPATRADRRSFLLDALAKPPA